MHTLKQFILISFLFFIQNPLFAQETSSLKINRLLDKYYAYGQFNGAALVAQEGKVIFKKGFGYANFEWDIPNTPDTKFRLGSITKQFTAMLILQLAEKGKLKLDGKITDYLPYYPQANGSRITLYHLLTHTSGIPNYTALPDFFRRHARNPFTPKDFTAVFSELPLEFEPGSKYRYSNSGYFVLGAIIEAVTKQSYASVLQHYILTPLKMSHTGYDLATPVIKKRAAGYEKNGQGGYVNAQYLDMSLPYAAGSLYSTVEDLYLWDQALYTDKLINAASKKNYFTPFLDNYALGWGIHPFTLGNTKDTVNGITHGGGINGFNTIIVRIPSGKDLIVLLNNTGGADLEGISRNILGILYNKPYDQPKKSIAGEFERKLAAAGMEAAKEQLYQQQKNAREYKLDEREMNTLGYRLLRDGKITDAIALFDINVTAFPDSWNVYDSRGEAYMIAGNKEQAIKDYNKSLKLNAQNTGAIKALKKLEGGEEVTGKDTADYRSYTGKYQLMPSFFITITVEGEHIYEQVTGQERFEIFPQSPGKFFLKVVDAQISFVKNEQGGVDQLILHQNGRDIPGKRVE